MTHESITDVSIEWPDDRPRDYAAGRRPRRNGPLLFLLLLLLLALLLRFYPRRKAGSGPAAAEQHDRPPQHVFYYSEETETIQHYPLGAEPPSVQTDTDRPPVRAQMFRRGFGVDAGEPFVAYLEKPAPGMSWSACEASKRNYGPNWGKGLLIRRPTDDRWVPADSTEGHAIIAEAYGTEEKCQQGRMVYSR